MSSVITIHTASIKCMQLSVCHNFCFTTSDSVLSDCGLSHAMIIRGTAVSQMLTTASKHIYLTPFDSLFEPLISRSRFKKRRLVKAYEFLTDRVPVISSIAPRESCNCDSNTPTITSSQRYSALFQHLTARVNSRQLKYSIATD